MKRSFTIVDVFTDTALKGNPVAVVLDSEGLDTATMQAIAAWTNLSETTFLLPPEHEEADYRLRIFTPRSELPFAGHPTLGSAHAALQAGRITPREGSLVQQCKAGLVPLHVSNDAGRQKIALTLPQASITPLDEADITLLERGLGIPIDRTFPPLIINVGAIWTVARLAEVKQLLSLEPDYELLAALDRKLGVTGVSLFSQYDGEGRHIEVRSFAPAQGVQEDPVCGSGNGSVAVFRQHYGLTARSDQGNNTHTGDTEYEAMQGQCLGRAGRITVQITDEGVITLAGECVTTVEGTLSA